MTVIESVVVGMFTLTLVFVVLAALYTIVMLLSKILGFKAKGKTAEESSAILTATDRVANDMDIVQISSGELKLKNVDEKTAAMIMAIVSDESGIPLSELCFKSISAMD